MHVRRPAAGDPPAWREQPSSKIGSDLHQATPRGSCFADSLQAVPPTKEPVNYTVRFTFQSTSHQDDHRCFRTVRPRGNVDTRLSCMPNWTGRTRADISGLECGQKVGRSYGGIHMSPCRVVLWHFHLGCHLQLRPRMQVRRGTAHAFKILHCNHTENGSADWWTALHILLGQTDYRSGQMSSRR